MIIIDRFEGEYAIIETDDGMMNIEKKLISGNAEEGDILKYENGFYIIDDEQTRLRREKMLEKLNNLRKGG